MLSALVIGGSLGGLFAANMLQAIGWHVDVYERVADDLATRGAGIGTHDELFSVMRRLGIAVDASIGVEVRERVCLDHAGKVLHEVALPQMMTAWARIYRPLKDLLPTAQYHFGVELARIEQDAQGVTANFSDGSTARADLLIAADGIRSTVRAQVLPAAEPRYAGYIAWRGVVDESAVSPATHAAIFERYAFGLPVGEMMLVYPVPGRDNDVHPGRRSSNFVWYRPCDFAAKLPRLATDAKGHCHGVSIPPPMITPGVIAEMRAEAKALLAPQIYEIVERAPQPFFQAIFDLESPRMTVGRVALLGDAAFVARPHVGMGVTKAALDAQCLAQAIAAAPGDLTSALARYDRERRVFGTRVVARSRRLGAYIEAQLKPPELRTAEECDQRPEVVLREIGAKLANIQELTAPA
ncbi:MAG TPA: FAD binding domain-containing protein [Burkholderiales bacterium]|nr:FAD binding domain-containing protein [Burkholderiales bacterium]